MKKIVILLIGSAILISGAAYGSGKAHWGYSGDSGPEHWGELDKKFAACSKGKNQSPINLTGFVEADLEAIKFNYQTSVTEILNNGHTVQANYAKGSTIFIDGKAFELKQFHFHAPSENHINGKSFPMEAHLVHADKDGNLAVVAVMFTEGSSNHLFESLWKKMPKKTGDKHAISADINAMELLPKDKAYYRFNGSLTTPPCTEGVRWFVMKQPVTISEQQVKAFEQVMHNGNNRPVQPANARPVLQ